MEDEKEAPLHNSASDPRVVLIAVDASGGANAVVATGARLMRSYPAAAVHVVHVFRASRFDRSRAGTAPPPTDAIEESKDFLEFHLRTVRKVCRNAAHGHFLIGDPSTEVSKLATQIHADLLVIGTHDYSGLERFLLGSIAETLMRKVACSVFIVRPPPHRD